MLGPPALTSTWVRAQSARRKDSRRGWTRVVTSPGSGRGIGDRTHRRGAGRQSAGRSPESQPGRNMWRRTASGSTAAGSCAASVEESGTVRGQWLPSHRWPSRTGDPKWFRQASAFAGQPPSLRRRGLGQRDSPRFGSRFAHADRRCGRHRSRWPHRGVDRSTPGPLLGDVSGRLAKAHPATSVPLDAVEYVLNRPGSDGDSV